MKITNFIKSTILTIVGSALIGGSVANANSGYNILFDANIHNKGQPLNYMNTGCLIYKAGETMYGYSSSTEKSGKGEFYASGNEIACANVCASWTTSFTKNPGPYTWETIFMHVYPQGIPEIAYESYNEHYTAHFVCKTNYSPFYNSPDDFCSFPSLAPDPNPKKTPFVLVVHQSEYDYCSLKR